ncbi:MAG: hypothetical protein AVDCRST_MAG96-4145 [uncultured Segetibacter sp.]|uniref:Uncharacterized protein n=1 Tax=uncultured Segetibacter sp. TaxID=481133 RepID=A0A6J4U2E7_9BACT|nr:MAG: hypothetical protein AVDCRST_MAG96-4145 [uncultured Segetibacter sp.]
MACNNLACIPLRFKFIPFHIRNDYALCSFINSFFYAVSPGVIGLFQKAQQYFHAMKHL